MRSDYDQLVLELFLNLGLGQVSRFLTLAYSGTISIDPLLIIRWWSEFIGMKNNLPRPNRAASLNSLVEVCTFRLAAPFPVCLFL